MFLRARRAQVSRSLLTPSTRCWAGKSALSTCAQAANAQLLKAFSLSTLYQPSPTSGHLWKMTRVLLMVAAQMEPARYMRRLTRPRRVIYNDCRWMPPAQMRVSRWPRCCVSMISRPRMGSSSCHAIFSALLDAPLRASMGARSRNRCCSRWQAGWWISTGRANI